MGILILLMGAFLILVSLPKLAKWKRFADAYMTYDLMAKGSKTYAYIYPLIELGLGFSYLFTWKLRIIAAATLVLMAISAVGATQGLLSEKHAKRIQLIKFTLAENIIMGLTALWLLFAP